MHRKAGLCSSRAQWPLAPNFCIRAIRKCYFFHTNHMLGTLQFSLRAQPCLRMSEIFCRMLSKVVLCQIKWKRIYVFPSDQRYSLIKNLHVCVFWSKCVHVNSCSSSWLLRSHQASQQTISGCVRDSLGCLCHKPEAFKISRMFVWM